MRGALVRFIQRPAPQHTPHIPIHRRGFANIRTDDAVLAFTPSTPYAQPPPPTSNPQHDPGSNNRTNSTSSSSPDDPSPPSPRTLKLGKTLRILQPRLPTLLASPLPQEILSPQISLHLFPSTHPHLPTVSGRVAYHAALWTSPITWGKIPLVGNVQLEILSERMVGGSHHQQQRGSHRSAGAGGEKLVVRWRTSGKTKGLGTGGGYRGIGAGESVDKITAWLGGDESRDDREFCGKFIFAFDEEGRIWDHVIERAEEGPASSQQWENGVGGRVVGLTDWLLGRLGGRGNGDLQHGQPGVALLTHGDGRREERT